MSQDIDMNDIGVSLFDYKPSKAAPIVMAVAFTATMTAHGIQLRHFKSWRLTLALCWGGLLFVAGFCVREATVFHDHDLNMYIATQVLIIAAPPIYSLTNYLMLGRALYYVPYLSPLHPGRVLTTFVGLDVVVEILTGQGASKVANLSSTPAQINIGKNLLRASLLLQCGLFALFIALEITFHLRCLRADILSTSKSGSNCSKLRAIFALLYASSAFIIVRNVFRVLETWDVTKNPSEYLNSHEAFFYVFDATLMLCNSVMLNIWHPGRYLPRDHTIFLAMDGVTEVQGPGWIDKRKWYVTVMDPFDLWGLFSGKDKRDKWWEGDGEWALKARGEGVNAGEVGV